MGGNPFNNLDKEKNTHTVLTGIKIESTLTELCFQDLNYDKLGKIFHTLKLAQVGLSRDKTALLASLKRF